MLRFISIRLLVLGKIKQTLKVFRITVNVRYWYNEIICFQIVLWKTFFEIQGKNKECRYCNECNCSYYGLVFIAWKDNGVNKSIVCTPPPFCRGTGVEPPTKFSERGLDRASTFTGGMLGKRGLIFLRRGGGRGAIFTLRIN